MNTLTLDLKMIEILALFDVLASSQPKGRVEARIHGRIFAELNKLRTFTDEVNFMWNPKGTVVLKEEAQIEFLFDKINDRVKAGYPGHLTEGYNRLIDELEKFEKADT